MGLYASAELIWGIPVLAYDEDTGDPTIFWDEENEDWREFEGEIHVRGYGHYEDSENTRGILTSSRVEPLRGDCWDPKQVPEDDLHVFDKDYSKSEDQARANSLPVSFYGDAKWWLVASFG